MTSRATIAPGVIASAGFVGAAGSRVFVARTSPDSDPVRRLVICPPFGGEAPRNYRREVDLSRRLARFGVETIRFHYRGTGQSDPVDTFGFKSMMADAGVVRDSVGSGLETVWMGTRVGGLVAAGAGNGPIVVWDPVLDANGYFREILRASVFSAFRSDDPGTAPKTDLIKHLQTQGEIDLLGYRVTERFYREVCAAPSLRQADIGGRHILIIDIRRRGTPRNETNRVAEALTSRGGKVTVHAVALNEPWWYGARAGAAADDMTDASEELLSLTTDFVTAHHQVSA